MFIFLFKSFMMCLLSNINVTVTLNFRFFCLLIIKPIIVVFLFLNPLGSILRSHYSNSGKDIFFFFVHIIVCIQVYIFYMDVFFFFVHIIVCMYHDCRDFFILDVVNYLNKLYSFNQQYRFMVFKMNLYTNTGWQVSKKHHPHGYKN